MNSDRSTSFSHTPPSFPAKLASFLKTRVRTGWWYLVGVWLIFVVPIFLWVFIVSSPVRSTGHAFLKALEQGDYASALDLCSPGLRKTLVDDKQLKAIIQTNGGVYHPWYWTSYGVSGDVAKLESSGRTLGTSYSVRLRLEKVDGRWLIAEVNSYVSNKGAFHLVKQDPIRGGNAATAEAEP